MNQSGVTKREECTQINILTGRASVAGKDGSFYDIVCYNCKRHGHISYNCPNEDNRKQGNRKVYNMAQLCLTLMQKENSQDAMINKNWVLLDTYFHSKCVM